MQPHYTITFAAQPETTDVAQQTPELLSFSKHFFTTTSWQADLTRTWLSRTTVHGQQEANFITNEHVIATDPR